MQNCGNDDTIDIARNKNVVTLNKTRYYCDLGLWCTM